ncbi:MAG: hypothetical protein IKD28_05945 [Clostridia bacterium]|nr:hypothetical protein [Clostridia bacterium]
MKKILALLLCVCMLAFALVACAPEEEPSVEAEYKLGMGVSVSTADSATGNAQVDATVATVVTDKDGKIVACRIDVAQNKMTVTDGAVNAAQTFQTKMERGDAYGMAAALNYGMDWNGDGVVKEWYDQAKAFEAWCVGKTVTQVEALTFKQAAATGAGAGYQIANDDALLAAGCTIQVDEFQKAVAAACKDEQGVTFKTSKTFTLGVAASTVADESVAATADTDGVVKMYSDFAAAVIIDGKIAAALNDAIQPQIAINAAGEIGTITYVNTKRLLKEAYNMAPAVNYGPNYDPNGDGQVKEWYLQSKAFSEYVVGKTATEVSGIATSENALGYQMATDEALLNAGCTIQITAIKAVMAKAATNAR